MVPRFDSEKDVCVNPAAFVSFQASTSPSSTLGENTGVWAPCFCWHRPGGWRPCCLLFGGRSHLCLWGASRSLRSGCVDPCVAGTLSLQWRAVPWGSLYWQVRLLLNTWSSEHSFDKTAVIGASWALVLVDHPPTKKPKGFFGYLPMKIPFEHCSRPCLIGD